jgi:hypothetical protein
VRLHFLIFFPAVSVLGFSQSAGRSFIDCLESRKQDFILEKFRPFKDSSFLEIAAKGLRTDLDRQPERKVHKSILAYDLKPLPTKPYFYFIDPNNFEAIYKTNNLAYYEALKNTALSKSYNPFTPHKQL